jgi:IMP dehydrogenase/GMP reductase
MAHENRLGIERSIAVAAACGLGVLLGNLSPQARSLCHEFLARAQ